MPTSIWSERIRRWLGLKENSESDLTEHRALAVRYPASFPVVCRLGQHEFWGEVLDIHGSGMRLAVSEALEPETTLFVYSVPVEGEVQRQANCRVAWCREQGDHQQLGLEFNPSDENQIGGWLSTLSPNVVPDPSSNGEAFVAPHRGENAHPPLDSRR